MRTPAGVLMLLATSSLALASSDSGVQQDLKSSAATIRVSRVDSIKDSQDLRRTEPSVTSVHQVWTSSSGSLDELSPETISKLRQDVPFLTAYALRPRLVGISSQIQSPPSSSESLKTLQLEASSPQASKSLIGTKLSDFDEFKVETSSLSKSEHHHKRKTTLKRDGDQDEQNSKRKVFKKAAESIKKRKAAERSRSRVKKQHSKGRSGRNRTKLAHLRRKNIKWNRNRRSRVIKLVPQEIRKGDEDSGVKGSRPINREPFYSKAHPSGKPDPDEIEGGQENSIDHNQDDDEDYDQLDEPFEPKRIGDGDIEEGGDTVMVEPKSDGVDDDPEIPIADDEESPNTGKDLEPEGRDESEDEPRTRSVNKDRPNQGRADDDEDDGETGDDGGGSAVNGGGIGATVGGGSSDGSSSGSGSGRNAPNGKMEPVAPGVEFASDSDKSSADNDDEDISDDGKKQAAGADGIAPRDGSSSSDADSSSGGSSSSVGDDGRNFDDEKASNRPIGSKDETDHDSDDPDLDYRDEIEKMEKRHNPDVATERDHHDRGKKSKQDCDDGSYDHHGDHHGHHSHHDTTKWLQDAIPGEPGEDYPTLSRANLTKFNCADQKYPGYYADTEARCQVFHICQVDGRQDSFLCPNGTIYSQKNFVCVWWDSFDCENAPKYYHLNALLYETSRSRSDRGLGSELEPRDGTRINREDGTLENDDEDSSIDALIRSMKKSKKELDDEDETTVQRKSTDVDDSADLRESSRGRRQAEPRSKRGPRKAKYRKRKSKKYKKYKIKYKRRA